MNYAQIITHDIANGPGMRLSLFVSGCSRNCKGCFNKEAQNKEYGFPFAVGVEDRLISELSKSTYQGITILGGEPFEDYNKEPVYNLLLKIRTALINKDIWIYTGFTYEELIEDRMANNILNITDVLVDGPFVESLKNLSLRFRGSSNQRIIDLKKSTKGNIVLSPYMDREYIG